MFGWAEDTQGCPEGLFEPEDTVMFLYTFAEYENGSNHNPSEGFKKDIVLHATSSKPDSNKVGFHEKPIDQVFEWRGKAFLPNETYFVGAMYTSSLYGTTNYSMPQMGLTPLYVPSCEIAGLAKPQ